MPRTGWTTTEVPDGLQMLRGAATTSGEVVQGKQASARASRTCTPRTNGRSVSEDSAAKTEVESPLKRAKQGSPVTRVDPDTRVAAARERAPRMEWALAAMGDFEGPEVESWRTALKRAQKDAQEVPVEVQIREREAFIERARKRIAKIDEERASEVQSMKETVHTVQAGP